MFSWWHFINYLLLTPSSVKKISIVIIVNKFWIPINFNKTIPLYVKKYSCLFKMKNLVTPLMMLSKEFCFFAVYNFELDLFPTSHHRHANSVEVIPTTHFFLQWFHRINLAKVRKVSEIYFKCLKWKFSQFCVPNKSSHASTT